MEEAQSGPTAATPAGVPVAAEAAVSRLRPLAPEAEAVPPSASRRPCQDRRRVRAVLRSRMERAGGRRSVPQIFINNEGIGGFLELRELALSGRLDGLLSREINENDDESGL